MKPLSVLLTDMAGELPSRGQAAAVCSAYLDSNNRSKPVRWNEITDAEAKGSPNTACLARSRAPSGPVTSPDVCRHIFESSSAFCLLHLTAQTAFLTNGLCAM